MTILELAVLSAFVGVVWVITATVRRFLRALL
jgi:hypothetical protein